LAPHDQTSPALVSAEVNEEPAAMLTTFVNEGTRSIAARPVFPLLPSSPNELHPLASTRPSFRRTAV
jgi:hypothetical protein